MLSQILGIFVYNVEASMSDYSKVGRLRSATIKILIVDDHRIVRSGLKSLLSDVEGIEVVGEAQSGEEAIEQILNHPTHWAYINGEFVAAEDIANIRMEDIEDVYLMQAIVGGSN